MVEAGAGSTDKKTQMYAFRNSLVKDVCYHTLLFSDRSRIHRFIAQVHLPEFDPKTFRTHAHSSQKCACSMAMYGLSNNGEGQTCHVCLHCVCGGVVV
jgi:hypothetical protein